MSDQELVLIVDDTPTNIAVISGVLEDSFRIKVATNGDTALAIAQATDKPDLILLDVEMPEMDGYEVCRRLKANPATCEVPIIFLTGRTEAADEQKGFEVGAVDYIHKPFSAPIVLARVKTQLALQNALHTVQAQSAKLAEWNAKLEERVNEQLGQLENLSQLKRFFSPQLVEAILSGGADNPLISHRREVTVVFLDLRNFTPFAETSEPEEVMRVLREFHTEMGKLILEHEGTLERFTGDGMVILFNEPVVVPNPAERALRMAVAMRERVNEMSIVWRKQGYDLSLGIGIAQGYATIGAIGFEGRLDYGSVGAVINLAARLCGEAQGGQILTNRKTLSKFEQLVEAENIGELNLKGFVKPISTLNITALVDRNSKMESVSTSPAAAKLKRGVDSESPL
jgi:PleD family two-component response regulator